jgi:hypothetical protein
MWLARERDSWRAGCCAHGDAKLTRTYPPPSLNTESKGEVVPAHAMQAYRARSGTATLQGVRMSRYAHVTAALP